MTAVGGGLLAQLVLAALAVLAAVVAPARVRSSLAGAGCVALGLAAVATGVAAAGGGTAGGALRIPVSLPLDLPLDPLVLAPDRLGGVFMLVAGAVGAVSALFGIGYAEGPAASRTAWASFAALMLGMQLVPAAGDVVSFLLAWETMAVGSTVLLLADHARRTQVRPAALWYAVMTHLSFVLLLAGFAVLAAEAGGTSFATIADAMSAGADAMSAGAGAMPEGAGGAAAGAVSAAATAAFLLLTAGFATKAGLVPLHVWLPRAHPEAPSHVSAAMSAAMVKMGVYGLMLVPLRLLPDGPRWWSVLLLVLGASSALYGILQASVASDLKRLLAYSTTENVGLMVTAVAVALLLRDAGQAEVADVALTAALLLVVSHAAFKTVLFLGAGSVLHATGERNLDRMGGLGRRMPVTATAFGVAALGAAALPVTSGFVAEWVLLQSLVHGGVRSDRLVAVAIPVTLSVVALTAGLALLTFVKAYGIAFLARPRSDGAARAHEGRPITGVAVLLGAAAVLAVGLLPGPVAAWLAAAVGAGGVAAEGLGGVDLTAVGALLDPVALAMLAAAVALPVAVVTLVAARRRPRREVDLAWGCGGARLSPRMQYTATSYAEPLVRVFDDALRPTRDLQVTHAEESEYLVSRVAFRQQLSDVVEDRVYAPAAVAMLRAGNVARRVQNGSIHRYLAFSFVALVVVLLVVAL